MYKREELKALKHEFWTGFDTYCLELPKLRRQRGKFLLYNTRIKGVEMKFDANRDGAYAILEVCDKNEERRNTIFQLLQEYCAIIEKEFPEKLIWNSDFVRESGQHVARVYAFRGGLDIHRREHWPEFYAFMADAMIKIEKAFKKIKTVLEEV